MNYTLTSAGDVAGPFFAERFPVGINVTTTMPLDIQRSLDEGVTWVTVETVNTGSKNVVGPGMFRLRATANGSATVQILR